MKGRNIATRDSRSQSDLLVNLLSLVVAVMMLLGYWVMSFLVYGFIRLWVYGEYSKRVSIGVDFFQPQP